MKNILLLEYLFYLLIIKYQITNAQEKCPNRSHNECDLALSLVSKYCCKQEKICCSYMSSYLQEK